MKTLLLNSSFSMVEVTITVKNEMVTITDLPDWFIYDLVVMVGEIQDNGKDVTFPHSLYISENVEKWLLAA